jgi:uncharacterized RDD family membrane protein YckC
MAWTDDVPIETPEQIELSLELSGVGSRFVAQVIDWVIKLILLVAVAVFGWVAGALLGLDVLSLAALVVVLFFSYFVALAYDVWYEAAWNGQTPGKRVAGIRVIREGGGPLDFRAACIRNVLNVADLLPAFYLLGGILILLTPRKQRLGDLAAGTVVIRERVLEAPVDVPEEVRRLASPEFRFTPAHLGACSPVDRNILRSFFIRYHQFQPRPRRDLAGRLAQVYLTRTVYQPPYPLRDNRQAETFLASLYRDLEQWDRHAR